jgi:hypothetical protein
MAMAYYYTLKIRVQIIYILVQYKYRCSCRIMEKEILVKYFYQDSLLP